MKILLLHSPSTKGGTKRILDFLCPEIEVDFAAHRPGNMSRYDGVILHNRVDVKPGEPTAIYPCGKPTQRMIDKPDYRRLAMRNNPRAIWVNSYTAGVALGTLKLDEKYLRDLTRINYMPKPFVLTIPDTPPPFPEEPRILWYWKPDWQYTERITDEIILLMKLLPEIEIHVISNKRKAAAPIDLPHVHAAGRLDLPKELHRFRAMVRITNGLDYGRSTYQVLAYGRPCLYCRMPHEPRVASAPDLLSVTDAVRRLIIPMIAPAIDKNAYVKREFSEDALKHKWQAEVRELFG